MRRRSMALLLGCGMAAVAFAAVEAPAEVLENLEFFSDMELLANLDLLEGEEVGAAVSGSTATAAAQWAVGASSGVFVSTATLASPAVKISTLTRRAYETR